MLRGVAFARKGQALDVDLSVLTTGALPDWVTKMRRRLGLMTKEEARADARFISFLNVDEFARAPLECTQWEAALEPRRSEVLADVKTVGYTKETVYKRYETFAASWRRVLLRKPGLAVSLRANKVRRDYLRAAKKRDVRFLTEEEMDEGKEGPFVQTIKSFGVT